MAEIEPSGISKLLACWGEGDREALQRLVPLIYEELRKVARQQLRKARPAQTLQTTALVHETYLRLEDRRSPQFQNRPHFMAVCALLMRQILIEHERTRRAAKRGGGMDNCTLEDVHAFRNGRPLDLIALDDALTDLERLDGTGPNRGAALLWRPFDRGDGRGAALVSGDGKAPLVDRPGLAAPADECRESSMTPEHMTPDRWRQIRDILHGAMQLRPAEQHAYLDRHCSSDPSLRPEVEKLLSVVSRLDSSFLESPTVAGIELLTDSSPGSASAAGQAIVIGPYRLLERIGQGGMGEVWLAEQKEPVRRRIAIKLIKAGMDTREVVTRSSPSVRRWH